MTPEQTSRTVITRRKWTDEEERLIRELLPGESVIDIANRIGRTAKAVNFKSRRLKTGVFGESRSVYRDGRVGAAAIGRILEISRHSVIRKLEDGYLVGEQVGHYWMVRPQSLGVRLPVEKDTQDTNSCINCGNTLAGKPHDYCSSRCHNEYVPGMLFPPHLRLGFQKWLEKDVNLLTKRPLYLRRSGRSFLNIDQELTFEEAAIEEILVSDFPGRIVPWEYLATRLEVLSGRPTMMDLSAEITSLKSKLMLPTSIFTVEGLGCGAGILTFNLTFPELKLLRQLWQKEGSFVFSYHLVRDAFGSRNVQNRLLLKETLLSLQDKIQGSPYMIDSKPDIFTREDQTRAVRWKYSLQRMTR